MATSEDDSRAIPQIDNRLLYGKYPLVGVDNATCYYLDTTSCTSYQVEDKYIIACIVYNTGGGYPPKVTSAIYKFSIRKVNDEFNAI